MLLQKINNKKGFTLIELVIVFIIVLILVATFSPHIYSFFVNENVTEIVVDEKTQPVPERKEVNKQKEGMTKL